MSDCTAQIYVEENARLDGLLSANFARMEGHKTWTGHDPATVHYTECPACDSLKQSNFAIGDLYELNRKNRDEFLSRRNP